MTINELEEAAELAKTIAKSLPKGFVLKYADPKQNRHGRIEYVFTVMHEETFDIEGGS